MRMLTSSLAPIVLVMAALPAHAFFKVVDPDGRVTYTDRPPPGGQGKVSALTSTGVVAADVTLPAELRQVAARWPVTLYTAPECAPCDEARRLLRTRGIPHTEKTVLGDEDRAAWARIVGGPEAPGLTIGAQALRGLDAARWHEYLDAAGYPRNSKLPPAYQYAAPLPLVPRRTEEARASRPAPAAVSSEDEPKSPAGFRF